MDKVEKKSAARPADKYPVKNIKGRWREQVFKKDVNGKERLVEDSGWSHNMIVATLPKLLAGLLANDPTFTGGILFHAVGEGNPSWDITPVQPVYTQATLTAEYFRKAPESIAYLDNTGAVVPYITNAILTRTTLDYNEANGPSDLGKNIREHGLFGGNATAALNSGMMVDVFHRHSRWKDPTIKILLFIELIF